MTVDVKLKPVSINFTLKDHIYDVLRESILKVDIYDADEELRLDERRLAERARIQELLQPHILWGEAKLLGIHQLHIRLACGIDHLISLSHVEAEGFLDDNVLTRLSSRYHDFAVQVVGNANHHHVDIGHGEKITVVGEMVRDAVRPRELLSIAWRW